MHRLLVFSLKESTQIPALILIGPAITVTLVHDISNILVDRKCTNGTIFQRNVKNYYGASSCFQDEVN